MLSRNPINHRLIYLTLALAGLAFTVQNAVLAPVLVDISQTFGVSVGLAGQLTTVSTLSVGILPLLGGPFIDRYSRALLIMISCLAIVVAALGTAVAPNFAAMLLLRLVSGMGIAIMWPAALAVAGESVETKQQGLATGWAIAGSNLGQVVGALAASLIAARMGWRWRSRRYIDDQTMVLGISVAPISDLVHGSLSSYSYSLFERQLDRYQTSHYNVL